MFFHLGILSKLMLTCLSVDLRVNIEVEKSSTSVRSDRGGCSLPHVMVVMNHHGVVNVTVMLFHEETGSLFMEALVVGGVGNNTSR